jgi:hypothetical protein
LLLQAKEVGSVRFECMQAADALSLRQAASIPRLLRTVNQQSRLFAIKALKKINNKRDAALIDRIGIDFRPLLIYQFCHCL